MHLMQVALHIQPALLHVGQLLVCTASAEGSLTAVALLYMPCSADAAVDSKSPCWLWFCHLCHRAMLVAFATHLMPAQRSASPSRCLTLLQHPHTQRRRWSRLTGAQRCRSQTHYTPPPQSLAHGTAAVGRPRRPQRAAATPHAGRTPQ